jgi:hypothetical protein
MYPYTQLSFAGYRHLPLYIADGFPICYSNVFVHIDF